MSQKISNSVDTGKTLSDYDDGNNGDHERQSKGDEKKDKQKRQHRRRHPLKMPLRTDPVTNRIICRFHNYEARSGCKKYNDRHTNRNHDGENLHGGCELDHETCHVCLEKGHPAHRCNHLDDPTSKIWRDFCSLTLENTRPKDYPTNKTVLGDPIVWIGDTATISVPANNNNADAGDRSSINTTSTVLVSPPNIRGFKLGEDDQLGRCKRQKKIEAAFMLQLRHGSVVVDAGAHLGDTVLTLAVHARAKNRTDLQFVALEPCPEKCEFISSAVAANNLLETVTVRCTALGDSIGSVKPASNSKERAKRDGSLRYEYYDTNSERPASNIHTTTAAAVAAKNQNHDDAPSTNNNRTKNKSNDDKSNGNGNDTKSEGDTTTSSVPIISLDSIFDLISPLGMLHIDVEGWESNVLRGAKKALTTIPKHHHDNGNNESKSDGFFPCYIIAEAWTEKESLRRGIPGNAEEKIVRVMEDEVGAYGDTGFRFERINDIVDIERNLVFVRKRKGIVRSGT